MIDDLVTDNTVDLMALRRLALATALELSLRADDGLAALHRMREVALAPLPPVDPAQPEAAEARQRLEAMFDQLEDAARRWPRDLPADRT